MTINCPSCGRSFNKDLFPLGNLVHCPYCESEFRIEPAPAPSGTPPASGTARPEPAASPAPEPAPAEPDRKERPRPDSEAVPGTADPKPEPDGGIRISLQLGAGEDDSQAIGNAPARKGSPWPGFLMHLGVFAIVGFAAAGLNWIASPTVPWSLFAIGPWGAGVLIHLWMNLVGTVKRRTRFPSPSPELLRKFPKGPMIGFLDSLAAFIPVNAFLVFADFFTDHRITWSLWVAGIWGIFTAIHFWTALVRAGFGKTEPDSVRLAAKRGKMTRRWVRFLGSFGVYAIVNGGLVALNLAVSPGYLWSAWVAAAWGIGVFADLWRSAVASVDFLVEEKRSPKTGPSQSPSLVPVVLLNLSMWAAFALAGFAVPAFGGSISAPGILGCASGVLSDVGRFAVDFPFVYWGAAMAVSVLSFTMFAWSGPGRRRLANAVFYLCSTAFLAASAVTAAAVTSGLVSLQG